MKKREIVIVEDNDDLRELLGILLSDPSYELKMYDSAHEFKEYLKSRKPDVIVLDVMLPDGNGIEIGRSIKENPDIQHVPVLLMSANRPDQNIDFADMFIAKPFDVQHFKQSIEHFL